MMGANYPTKKVLKAAIGQRLDYMSEFRKEIIPYGGNMAYVSVLELKVRLRLVATCHTKVEQCLAVLKGRIFKGVYCIRTLRKAEYYHAVAKRLLNELDNV